MNLDLLLVGAALGLGGVVKGALGLGLPLVTVPALAAFLGVPHALAVMMVPLVLTNAWQVWHVRGDRAGTRFLVPLIGLGMVGVAIGTWGLTFLPVEALSLALAGMVGLYIALYLLKPDVVLSPGMGLKLAPWVGLFGGSLQGATGISAPITVTFVHALGFERRTFVFAVSAMFLVLTLVQLGSLTVAGIMTWERFLQGWIALAPIALGMPIGTWAASKLSRRAFERVVLALLAVMALRLLQTGLGL